MLGLELHPVLPQESGRPGIQRGCRDEEGAARLKQSPHGVKEQQGTADVFDHVTEYAKIEGFRARGRFDGPLNHFPLRSRRRASSTASVEISTPVT